MIRMVRSRRRAQDHWNKVSFVMFINVDLLKFKHEFSFEETNAVISYEFSF